MATKTYVAAWEFQPTRGLPTQPGEAVGIPLDGAPVHAAEPVEDLRRGLTSLCGRPVMADTPAEPWPPQASDDVCSLCSEKTS